MAASSASAIASSSAGPGAERGGDAWGSGAPGRAAGSVGCAPGAAAAMSKGRPLSCVTYGRLDATDTRPATPPCRYPCAPTPDPSAPGVEHSCKYLRDTEKSGTQC